MARVLRWALFVGVVLGVLACTVVKTISWLVASPQNFITGVILVLVLSLLVVLFCAAKVAGRSDQERRE